MLTRRRTGILAAGAAALSLLAITAVANADNDAQNNAQTDTDVEPIQIDFDELEHGSHLNIPWFADGAFHQYNVTWPANTDPLESFAALERRQPDGPRRDWVGLTNPAGDDTRNVVEFGLDHNGNVTSEVERVGDLGHLVASADGRDYAYVRDGRDVFISVPSGGEFLTHDDARTVGFADGRVVINETRDSKPSIYLYDYRCDDEEPDTCHTSRVDGVLGATATSDTAGLIAVTGEDENGELYSAILDANDDNREVWRSYDRRIESFSPNGVYAATVDIRSDGLGYTDIEILGAWDGQTRLRAEMETAQRIAWEPAGLSSPGNQLIFDAWDNGQQALVRCDVSAGCELATEPVPAGDPVEVPPHLLVTQ